MRQLAALHHRDADEEEEVGHRERRKQPEEVRHLEKERDCVSREIAFIYPDWLDEPFEFQTRWNVKDLMTYYAGIITPTALGRLSGINPKQIWAYMHGVSKPRKAQLQKMETALQQLGRELMHVSFC